MRRLTISLADRMHRALKEATGRQNRSMGSIVEESLELRGIRLCGTTKDIVAAVGLRIKEQSRHYTAITQCSSLKSRSLQRQESTKIVETHAELAKSGYPPHDRLAS